MKTQPHISLVKTSNKPLGFYSNSVVRGFEVESDEPEIYQGTNKAPAPFDYLNIALSSCTVNYLRAVTKIKGIEVGNISVKIKIYQNETKQYSFDRSITLEKEILNSEIDYLKQLVEETPVTKILKKGHIINTRFSNRQKF